MAAPSQRVVDAGWRLPLAALGNQGDNGPTTTPLNAGQVGALSRLHHNLEAITGPPGTGKSTIISALVTQCVPANDRTLVAAVQNRAVESIVQKLAQTAEDVPFIVHGNAKRLSPASKVWTINAQAERETEYLRFIRREEKACGFRDALYTGIETYQQTCFSNALNAKRPHRCELRERLRQYTTEADVPDWVFNMGFNVSPDSKYSIKRQLLNWVDAGGGDGWAKVARALTRHKFPVAHELYDHVKLAARDYDINRAVELQSAKHRVTDRARALVCTCAATGSLIRQSGGEAPPLAASLAGRCTTLVVDEAGTCADSCLVPALPYNEIGRTFERLVVVGDAAQLPPFTRLRGDDAPVSLIERVHNRVGSSLLTVQYRMFDQLCRVVSQSSRPPKTLWRIRRLARWRRQSSDGAAVRA